MFSKRKEALVKKYEDANLDFKKEMLQTAIICLAIIGLAVFAYVKTKQIIVAAFASLFLVTVIYYSLTRPNRIIDSRKKKIEEEFVHVFAYFSIFVKNKRPVYNALEDCLRYSSDDFSKKLQKLLEEIDNDKSVTPFIAFGDNFTNLEIKQILVSIYKMSVEGGGEEYLRQFDILFNALSNSKRQSTLEKERSHFGNFNFLPLLASALSMGIVAIAVLSLMEEYTNVI